MNDRFNSVPLNLEPYEVFDLSTDESHGTFETLEQARGCVRFDKLHSYSIWKGNLRVECCEPYEGNDDRVKQALGEPNWSEQECNDLPEGGR